MKKTSIKAYREELENGNISKKESVILMYLKHHKPCPACLIPVSGAWKRMANLERCGMVRVLPQKTISHISGKLVSVYEYCADQPLLCPPPTKRSSTSELKAEIVRLTKEIEKMSERTSAFYDTAYLRGYQDCANGHQLPEDI